MHPLIRWDITTSLRLGIVLAGRVGEMVASLAFTLSTWKRVKPFGI